MFNKILITLDGSELAEKALPIATELAAFHGAELRLLRVAEGEPTLAEKAVGYTWVGATERMTKDSAESRAYLETVAATIPNDGVAFEIKVEKGAAEARIVCYAEREGVDLIVMSTHGRTGLPNLILGSVAKGVVADAPCPVMLVRTSL